MEVEDGVREVSERGPDESRQALKDFIFTVEELGCPQEF